MFLKSLNLRVLFCVECLEYALQFYNTVDGSVGHLLSLYNTCQRIILFLYLVGRRIGSTVLYNEHLTSTCVP